MWLWHPWLMWTRHLAPVWRWFCDFSQIGSRVPDRPGPRMPGWVQGGPIAIWAMPKYRAFFFAPSGPSPQWKINSPWFFQLQGGRRISQNASIRDKIRFSAKVHIWSKISSWCMVHVWFWMKSLVRLFKMAEIASLQCVSSLLNLSKAEILIFSLIFDQMDLLTKNSDMSDLKTEKTQTSE